MSKLANIPQVDQSELLKMYRFAISQKENVLVIGPSGAGKTDMAFQACAETNKKCIYWNMSVMERPDIQGLPVVSEDKRTASFAPNEEMPFVGVDTIRDERALNTIISALESAQGSALSTQFLSDAKKALASVKENIAKAELSKASGFFDAGKLSKAGIAPGVKGNEESTNVLLLDEVDKTPPENLQPLLELLLYRSINGKPIDIQSVIMTGNLPDEQAYSEPLSHAITNRAMIFELKPNPKVWLAWGAENNLHPIVLGFLSREEYANDYFNKRPGNNEMYSYAYTTPRSWTKLSKILDKRDALEKAGEHKLLIDSDQMISSIIGEEATTKLQVWLDYYRKYDKLIDAVFDCKDGEAPDEPDAIIVVALAIANKLGKYTRDSDDTKSVQKKAVHIFNWISKNTDKDVKLCAMRSSYNRDAFLKHGLHELEETKQQWDEILEMYKAVNSANKI